MGFVEDVGKAVAPIASRVRAMVKRAVIERIDDTKGTQAVQVSLLADEVADGCEHMQPFGLSFHPVKGSDAVALAVQGDPGHMIIIAATKRGVRPTGAKEGEGGLYDKTGAWRVFIDENGVAHIGAQTGTDFVALDQKIQNAVDSKIRAIFNAHVHTDAMGGTGPPTTQISPLGSVGATNAKAK